MDSLTIKLFLIVMVVVVTVSIISNIKFRKKRRATNKKLELKLKEEKFNVTKTISVYDCKTYNSTNEEDIQKIYVDADNKKLFLTDYSKEKFYTIDFADVVDCEIFETSSVSSEGRRRDVNEYCNSMKLIIKINNMDMPQITYDIVFRKVDKESNTYRGLRAYLQETKSFFDVLKSEKASKRKKFVYCKYCGTKNSEEAPKCSSCGGDLR